MELTEELARTLITKELPFDLVAQKLDLSRVGNLKALSFIRRLDVSFNPKLSNLYGIEVLSSLRILSAYSCKVTNLDPLRQTPRLEVLRLHHNDLHELHDCFTNFKKLRELRLDYNHITRLDNYMISCSSLETLDISSNRLTSLEGLAGLQCLSSLRICNNSVRSLLPLRALPSLIELDISHNKLATLTGLEQLFSLETLFATHNQIKTLRVPQTYSKGGKHLPSSPPKATSSSSSTTTSSAAEKEKEKDATVYGMAKLTDIHLSHNSIASFDGLDTLGIHIELLMLDGNLIEIDDSVQSLLQLKRLSQLKLHDNPIKSDTDFVTTLVQHLKSHCPKLESFDEHMTASSHQTTVAAERNNQSGKTSNDIDSDDEEELDAENKAFDDNKHNANFSAPTLSLKDVKTPEEIEAMESIFKSLLTSCKETLQNILLKPDEPILPKAAQMIAAKTRQAPPDIASIRANEESVEQSASLFHFSSKEVVKGFRDTVDHRGTLVRPSRLTNDDDDITSISSTTSGKKPFVFQVDASSSVTNIENVEPPSPSSSKASLTSSGEEKKTTKSSSHQPTPPQQPQVLGSGLTLHGTRVRQKVGGGKQRRQDDAILSEMLERIAQPDAQLYLKHSSKSELDDAASMASVASVVSLTSDRDFESSSFLTASAPTMMMTTASHPITRTAVTTTQSINSAAATAGTGSTSAGNTSGGGGFSRFRPSPVVGIDTRFGVGAFDARGPNSARSTAENGADTVIDVAIINSIKQRRFSEPVLLPDQEWTRSAVQHSSPQYDDSDEDVDDNEVVTSRRGGFGNSNSAPKLECSPAPVKTFSRFRVPDADV